ncbi:HpcH/HpaI aldolase/citrate lyase family protein [Sphingomonas arantia]|uniref:HpcH/HpaI aldolase/citrate lyase family protein n=1 Tax=Sphingomonas arantia TaxID=1460676 RepID=A0ABW4U1W2_9SPHN
MIVRPRRSALYLPASNARAIEKARGLPCDVVILDLEDAVAPDAKGTARAQAVAAVRDGGFGARELVVRVNGLATPWGADDLDALATVAPDAVLVPKVNGADDVAAYRTRVADGVALWAMVETAKSVLRLEAIASAPGLGALVLGTNDLAKEMRARLDTERTAFGGMLAMTVAAARAFGLVVLDGVHNAIDDADGLARQCAQGAALGFDGKTLIHPAQIAACNAAFSPAADEVAWARRVVEAFEGQEGVGVIRVDGRMVERLHLAEARALLDVVAMLEVSSPRT